MGRRLERSTALRIDEELSWAVLCDYDQWQEWMPSVRSSQVLIREGDIAVVELLPVVAPRKILLEMIETPGVELRFTEVGRYGSDALQGRCAIIRPADGGIGRLAVEVDPGDTWWGRSRRRLAKRILPATLDAWGQRCLEVAASDFADDPKGEKALFEVFDQGDELILRLGDRDFRLSQVEGS